MIYHEGVGKEQKRVLLDLHRDLRNINSDSGVYVSLTPYHGKVYRFYSDAEESIYVGSSNFSASGFYTNSEFNAKLEDPLTKSEVVGFLRYAFNTSNNFVAPLDKVELLVKSTKVGSSVTNAARNTLEQFRIKKSDFPSMPALSSTVIKLRVDQQPNSSLNLFFDRGRKTSGGIYTPRPWFEVEVTTTKAERNQNADYPKGEFVAYVKDRGYFKIPMITASDGFKAIASRGNRAILGEFIKGKLQRLGFLQLYERVTAETLMEYGNDTFILEKIADKEYYMKF